MTDEFESALERTDPDRRTFLKKLVVGSAFVAPAVSSFTMTGIKAAYAQTPSVSGAGGAVGGEQLSQSSSSSSTPTTAAPTTTSAPTTSAPTTTTTTTTTTTRQSNQTVN